MSRDVSDIVTKSITICGFYVSSITNLSVIALDMKLKNNGIICLLRNGVGMQIDLLEKACPILKV